MKPPTLSELKGRSQRLKPVIHLGHDGITPGLLSALDQALHDHELVKVRFTDFKDQRKSLAAKLADKTGSRQILLVGHTLTLYRARPPGATSA